MKTVDEAIKIVTDEATRRGFKVSEPYSTGFDGECMIELSYDGVSICTVFIYDFVTHACIKFNRIYHIPIRILSHLNIIDNLDNILDDIKCGRHFPDHKNFNEKEKNVLKIMNERPDLIFHDYYGIWVENGDGKGEIKYDGLIFLVRNSYDSTAKETIYVYYDPIHNNYRVTRCAGDYSDEGLEINDLSNVYQLLDKL